MEKHDIRIRIATEDDAEALLAVYAPYVIKTAITFEYEVPTLEEFRGRIRHTLQKYPYLVAERDGTILGYAYVGPFHERAAYDWAVETSIYVEENLRRAIVYYESFGKCVFRMSVGTVLFAIAVAVPVIVLVKEARRIQKEKMTRR